jgi:hypothetical protein
LISTVNDEKDDVDTTLSHISSHRPHGSPSKKGRVEQIEWDAKLDEMSREKAAAEATRGERFKLICLPVISSSRKDLTTRFRAKSERMRGNTNATSGRNRKQG